MWGCDAYVKQEVSSKLDPRSIKCIFVGYPRDSLGYYFYISSKNKVFIARKAEFLENKFLMDEANGRQVDLEEDLLVLVLDIDHCIMLLITYDPKRVTPITSYTPVQYLSTIRFSINIILLENIN